MFERYSKDAKQVIRAAQEASQGLMHNYIGTEHLFLGLPAGPESFTGLALASLEIKLDAVRTEVVEIVGSGTQVSSGHIPFTSRAKKVLELALREALQLDANFVQPIHILLALAREGEGVAMQALEKLGVKPDQIRLEVKRLLSEGSELGLRLSLKATAAALKDSQEALGRAEHLLASAFRILESTPESHLD
ncbi:MAG: Clp protease N-terminal domain-containing protein [Candidatus Saccharimonas sp.]